MSSFLFVDIVYLIVLGIYMLGSSREWRRMDAVDKERFQTHKNFIAKEKGLVFVLFRPVLIALIIMSIVSSVYEFSPTIAGTQYKIIRDDKGIVFDLERNATGFHLPFCSGRTFVNLPGTMKCDRGSHIKFKAGDFGYTGILINYSVTCSDYPRVFIETNGIFADNGLFCFFGETDVKFDEWQKQQVEAVLNSSVPTEVTDRKLTVEEASVSAYAFILKRLKDFNHYNQYGLEVKIKIPRIDDGRRRFLAE